MDPIHILLVEDNEGDILLTTEALKEGRIQNETSVVKDGAAAMEFLLQSGKYKNARRPNLILLDVNLPKLNGIEVLQKIKTHETLRTIPVIMLTTSSAESDVYKSYLEHANCYITKPVDITRFLDIVTSIEDFWVSIVELPKQ